MDIVRCLTAADGLTLHLDASPHWRVAWEHPDWLGPIGLLAHHAGHWYRSLETDSGSQDAHLVRKDLKPFEGTDALGSYCGAEVSWHGLPVPVQTTVRAYASSPLLVFRIEAKQSIAAPAAATATGTFSEVSVAWPCLLPGKRMAGGVPDATRSYGHQYTEFALPVSGDAQCLGFFFAPHRPPVVMPLLMIAPGGGTLLLAPLDGFHEQILTVPSEPGRGHEGVRCGWHGDLAEVGAGFATELALWAAPTPRTALAEWAALLRQRHGTQRLSRYADDLVGKLSYWTDNGAVYYYRTEPGCDYETTLERAVADLHAREVPVRAVQIDSWFYPHQHLRPVSAEGAPIVPPSGMRTWEPRTDLFPDGFGALRRRCGNLPLAFHSRHFWTESPYFESYAAWHDGEYAHPAEPALYDLLMAQAASWGAITYEQDWMVESFLGVRGLREAPGRARAWQQAMDRAAAEHGLTLQWCMSTPADFMQSVSLQRLASIRTSGDYRYMFDNGLNWVWFLHTNALARVLGLLPFKDVFLSHGKTSLSEGEPYAEVEALLAALSAGPVGIGDQIGCTNRDIVMRTCREDGVLVKPDVPIAALDRCFGESSFFAPSLLAGECHSVHPAGCWLYVAAFNTWQKKKPLNGRIALRDLGASRPTASVLVYDWRRQRGSLLDPDGGWEVTLPFQDWDYRIVCPVLPGNVTVIGDVGKYATVGDRRVAHISSSDGVLQLDVLGVPQTMAEVRGWAAAAPETMTAWSPGTTRTMQRDAAPDTEGWRWDAATGLWNARVSIGLQGQTRVRLTPASRRHA